MKRRTFIASGAVLAGGAVSGAPLAFAQAKPEQSKVAIAVGGKNLFYYLPLTIAERRDYFKDEGLEVEISRFRRRREGAAGGGRRQRRRRVAARTSTRSTCRRRTSTFRAFVLQGRAPQIVIGVSTKSDAELQVDRRPEGQEDRRDRAGLVDQHGRQPRARARRALKRERRRVHRRGRGRRRAGGAALRPDRRDRNTDPVMTMLEQTGDVSIISDTRTLEGTQERLRRPHAGGAASTRRTSFIDKNPNTVPGARQRDGARRSSGCRRPGPSDIIKTVPESYLLGDRALYLASFNKVREAIVARRPDARRRSRDRAEGACRLRPDGQGRADRPVEDLHQRLRQEGAQRRSRRERDAARPFTRLALALDNITCTFASRDDRDARYTAVQRHHAARRARASSSRWSGRPAAASPRCSTSAPGCSQPSSGEVRVFGEPLAGINRARRLHVPGRSADAVAHGARQRDGGPAVPRRAATRGARAGRRVAGARRPRRLRRPLSAPALGRHAQARRRWRRRWSLDPDIILMDEPFSALDIQTRQLMENEVLELWAAKRKAVLFITHDLDEAIAMSDRVVVLSAGPATHPIGEFAIDLPRPRDVAEVRTHAALRRTARADLGVLRDEVLKGYRSSSR